MTDFITVQQRGAMFRATCDLINLLLKSMEVGEHSFHLNKQLLDRLASASINCPGFTPVMKDDIVWLSAMDEQKLSLCNQPANADTWRHIYALAPKPGAPNDLIEVSFKDFAPSFVANLRLVVHRRHPYADAERQPLPQLGGKAVYSRESAGHGRSLGLLLGRAWLPDGTGVRQPDACPGCPERVGRDGEDSGSSVDMPVIGLIGWLYFHLFVWF